MRLLYKHTVKNRVFRMACVSLKRFFNAVALVKYWFAYNGADTTLIKFMNAVYIKYQYFIKGISYINQILKFQKL